MVGLPIFYRDAEFNLHKQMGRELVETLINQQFLLYRIDNDRTETNFYNESKNKQYKAPISITARISISDVDIDLLGGALNRIDKGDLVAHIYTDHLADLGIEISMGDMISFEDKMYEIHNPGKNLDSIDRKLGADREYYITVLAKTVSDNMFMGR